MDINKNSPLRGLPGIGEKKAAFFARMGITNIGELLYHFPRGYQHRGDIRRLADAADGEVCAFLLTVASDAKTAPIKNRMTITKFTATDSDGSASCAVVFFNQPYLKSVFIRGAEFRFWGKLTKNGGMLSLSSPQYEPYTEGVPLPEFKALYPLTEGLTQKIVSNLIYGVLDRLLKNLPETVPFRIRERFGLCSIRYALNAVHRPKTFEELNRGRDYFIFEELYLFALAVTASKSCAKKGSAPKLALYGGEYEAFLRALPYDLTGAQKRSVNEILADLASGLPMNRMLSGDVGSGKTVCAAAAVYCAVKSGYQAALMAPTEILARQHYNDLLPFFLNFGIRTAFLSGALKLSEKRAVYALLTAGELDFVVGTHAVLSEGVRFSKLGLVVTDEQHRFGVAQRAALTDKAVGAGEGEKEGKMVVHTLVMSATPIPRSLALVMYGDLDLSVLDEMPPGRQKVDTFVVDGTYRERLYKFIRKQTDAGRQVYVVCPSVEARDLPERDDGGDGDEGESENEGKIIKFDYGYDDEAAANAALPLANAADTAAQLQKIFPDLAVGCVHGRQKSSEKEKVMRGFANNEIKILVSTTVIEVGVNVPNATLMIVENAERFGLSQLHQLRGRVGRGKDKSYCVLITDSKSELSAARLDVMRQTNDGYKIAERDLELRGPGDFFMRRGGETRQHGGFRFRLASLCTDVERLKNAFAAASDVLASDPRLEREENRPAKEEVTRMSDLGAGGMN